MTDQSHLLNFDLVDFLPFQMSAIATRLFARIIEEAGLQIPECRLVVELSEKGKAEVKRLQRAARKIESDLLDRLQPEDRAYLTTTINALYSVS